MNLLLHREILSPEFTLGKFYIDGKQSYYTLERPYLNGANTPGVAAILPGTYEIIIAPSPKFGRDLPRLLDVPERSGILVHPANHASELRGCIALGLQRTKDGVGASKMAVEDFQQQLAKALEKGKVYVEIR